MKFFDFIGGLFFKVFRTIKSILKAVFTASFQLLLERLKDIATETISTLATTDLSNDQKRKRAFDDIKQYALGQALTFNDSDIFLVIELIHKQLKNDGVIK